MSNVIDIKKLEKNSIILLETKDTVFEIAVTGPRTGMLIISGGILFIRPTKVKITGTIKRGRPVKLSYTEKDESHRFSTSEVISATVFGPNKSWRYDAIEPEEKNENTDKA